MTPYYVEPDFVDDMWLLVLPWITDALSRGGDYTANDIRQGCKENRFQLWIVATSLFASDDNPEIAAVIVTAITETPRRKACQIMLATGNGRIEWQHMIAELERWAKQNGCTVMKPIARKGWSRVLAPYGYRMTHVVLEKDL